MPGWKPGDILIISISLKQASPEPTVDFTSRKRACKQDQAWGEAQVEAREGEAMEKGGGEGKKAFLE